MTTVIARPGENIDSLLRRFKKAVDKSGVLADLRRHESYEKPSVQKKKKQALARKRAAKLAHKFGSGEEKKVSNQNFKWNYDHTKKIPMPPPRNNYNNRNNNYNKKPLNKGK